MTLIQTVTVLKPLFESSLFSAVATAALSAFLGAHFGLRAFRHQTKELVDGVIAWQWTSGDEGANEEPFLVLQNRSPVAAYVVRARYLRGLFIRTEAKKYVFDYPEPTDGNFPLEVKPQGVSTFPLSIKDADRIVARAHRWSRGVGYLVKRPYLWIEITTISGHRLMIPANDVTTFIKRPLWLEGRWFPEPKPDWMLS